MTGDIFKLFKKSIEQIDIKKTTRGTLTDATVYSKTLDAIVKRRNGMTEAVSDSEDYSSNTTIHFRSTDSQYVEVGNFVKIDGHWRSIIMIKDGKDFDKGTSQFLWVTIGNDILEGDDPVWGTTSV